MLKDKNEIRDDAKSSGSNVSYWIDSVKEIQFSSLTSDMAVDVVIVGGGIAGVSTAYILSKEGKKVALIEDGNLGSGETGRTTAHLVNALDDRYYDIEKYFGEDGARIAAESHTAAIYLIEKIIKDENIDCDFKKMDGYLFLHPSDDTGTLQLEFEASQRAGIKTELIENIPSIQNIKGSSLRFPDQAMFHPLKYLAALAGKIIDNGSYIYTKTHVNSITETGVETDKGFKIFAQHIIIATNTPINNTFVMHTKIAPYRTYVTAFRIPKDSLEKALWWDTGDHNSRWTNYPYHYVRTQSLDDQFDLLMAGGEDHKTGQSLEENISEEERYKALEDWTRNHFPQAGEMVYKWSGQVMEPVDSLGFIGRNPMDKENIFIVTGDSGNGMTHGTIAGILLTDLIMGRENPWEELYSPSRKTFKAAGHFIKEQANVVKRYLDYFREGDTESIEKLNKGSGAILGDGLNKAAVYKDYNGKLYSFSAACTHLKCIVKWNSDEKTFDCPCHGSRFNRYGKVINGPANMGLEPIEIPKEELKKKE